MKIETIIIDDWKKHSRQWQNIGPPLRPQEEDITFLRNTIVIPSDFSKSKYDILLLGVTPELVALPWPTSSHMLAVDKSRAMIQQLWRPNPAIRSHAVRSDWFQLPVGDENFDLILGDCCMTLMHPEQDRPRFLKELRRVLRPGGRLALRLFVRPEISETPENVFDDLWNNRIGNFHIFRWRLLMALHGSSHEGVLISRAWDYWQQSVLNNDQIVACTGWDPVIIATMEAYRDSISRYFFLTLEQSRNILGHFLTERDVQTPTYELGCCCSTVIYSSS